MEKLLNIKTVVAGLVAVVGGVVIKFLGGYDIALRALFLFMAIDYILGLLVAGVFQESTKSDTGGLNSFAGWKGLVKKGITLLVIIVAVELDMLLGVDFIRYGTIMTFASNELISIVENVGLAGVKFPPVLRKALDLLEKEHEKEIE